MHWEQRRSQKSFPANNRNSRSKEECTKFRVNGLFSNSNMICEALEEPPHLQLAQFYAPQPLQLHPSFSPLCICAPLSVFTDPLRAKGHRHTGVQCTHTPIQIIHSAADSFAPTRGIASARCSFSPTGGCTFATTCKPAAAAAAQFCKFETRLRASGPLDDGIALCQTFFGQTVVQMMEVQTIPEAKKGKL